MSPLGLGVGVGASMVVFWLAGALVPPHPRFFTALDLRWYFFPQYEVFYGSLRAGTPLLWNPYQLCGVPLLGTLQGGFFYPGHVLYLALPTGWALATSTVLHLALAAGTGAAFARRVGLSAPGAFVAGTIFAATGTMRQWQLWPYLLEACAWIPLGAIGILDLTGGGRARGALVLALATGMSCLAGAPQGTVFAGYAWAGLLVVRLLVGQEAWSDRLRIAAAALAAVVAGGLLGAVALLPAYETSAAGVRPTATLSPALLYPMGNFRTIPDLVDWWLGPHRYALLAALALVPFAAMAAPRWAAVWAVAIGVPAALLALGPITPAFHLYYVLPTLGWFREPIRLLTLVALCHGILAGMGLDALTRLLRARAAGTIIAAAIVAALGVHGLRAPRVVPPLPYGESDAPWTAAQHDSYRRLGPMLGHDRVWPFSPTLFAHSLPPKLPSVTRLRSIEDYEVLPLRRQAEFFVYFLEGSTLYSKFTKPFEGRLATLTAPRGREPPAARRRLLDLTAMRFLLVPPPAQWRADLAAFVRDGGLRPAPAPAPDLQLFENPHALPRAYVTYRARRAPPVRELLARLADPRFDPLAVSFVEADADMMAAPDAPTRGSAATFVRDDPQVVEVEATLAAPGLVVLADTYAAGWQATVDGMPAPILATNHLFRGVPAPAGTHRVRFTYRPRALRLGAALSLASVLGLALLAWRVYTHRAA